MKKKKKLMDKVNFFFLNFYNFHFFVLSGLEIWLGALLQSPE